MDTQELDRIIRRACSNTVGDAVGRPALLVETRVVDREKFRAES